MAENTNPTSETEALAVAVTVTEEEKSAPNTQKEEENINSAVMEEGKPAPSLMKHIMFAIETISYLLSFPFLIYAVWLLIFRHGDCEDLLQLSKLQLGIVVGSFIVFVASILVVFLRSRLHMLGIIVVMVPLIVMLIVGLALVGAYQAESRKVPGSPMWLKMKVNSNTNWNNIKACIYDTKTCEDLITRSFMVKSYDFTNSKLSPIESGCCKPPSICDMVYVNATYWRKGDVVADGSEDPYDIDCDLWRNDETGLCYNCHACKEGFLRTIRGKWSHLGILLIVMSIFLMVSHIILHIATMWENHLR